MPGVKFDATISMGSIMSTAAVVLGLLSGYVAIKSDLQETRADIVAHERRLAFLEAERQRDGRDASDQRVQLNGRLTGLETNMLTLLSTVQELRRMPGQGNH